MNKEQKHDQLLEWYGTMMLIRTFEEAVIDCSRKGLFPGSSHPCIAQEAIAVGAVAALRPTDQVLATYRGHGQALARGLDASSLMAEILCKETGCCGGRGGSMHLCDVSRDFWGTNAIVAAHIPIAAGVALSNKLSDNDRVVAVFFGDGATCEGAFFETLNMAVVWNLPLVLVCENNGLAISVPTKNSIPLENIADRAKGFALASQTVDGNDPQAVHEAMMAACEHARSGKGPYLLECKTVRWERHSSMSAGKYANEAEAKRWMEVDPLPRLKALLLTMNVSEAEILAREEAARAQTKRAVDFAIGSPDPEIESLHRNVYCPEKAA